MMTTLRSATLRSEMAFDHLRDVFLRAKTDDRLGELAFLEEQQRGNAAHGEALGDIRVLVHVELRNGGATIEVRRERVDRRRESPARATPLGPEVYEHEAVLGLIIEVAVSERLDLFGCHSLISYAVTRCAARS